MAAAKHVQDHLLPGLERDNKRSDSSRLHAVTL